MNGTKPRDNFNTLLAIVMIAIAIVGIVLAALSSGALWSLIGGVAVLGVIIIGLSWVGVNMFSRWADAKVRIDTARYDFIQSMASKGALPNDGAWIPLNAQLEAPSEPDTALLTDSEVAPFKNLAIELIGVTYSRCGQASKRLISFNRCAIEKIEPFNDVDKWSGAENWLLNHGLAYKEMRGNKCIGVAFANGRTVADVYKQIVM